MPSPFPGMNPYLEEPGIWSDFHSNLISAAKVMVNGVLPPRYAAWSDRHVWLQEPGTDERELLGKPDPFVTGPEATETPGAVATLLGPATSVLPAIRREGERYLRIVDQQGNRVVTVIEFLSPSNKKAGDDRDAYLSKREEYLASGTNLLEVDLLRAGTRPPVGQPPAPRADYYVVLSRAVTFPRIDIWPISIRDPLPLLPVPLSPPDEPVWLSLQECANQAAAMSRYQLAIDYSKPPVPPLSEPDATWAREILAHRPV